MSVERGTDTLCVVEGVYAAWATRDLAGTLADLADDCVYNLHVPTDVVPYGGSHHGKAAIAPCLEAILVDYGFLAYAVDGLSVDGEIARAQVVYYYRHTDSGQQIESRFRHVWRVVDGAVVSIDEYHDVAKLKVFLAMV